MSDYDRYRDPQAHGRRRDVYNDRHETAGRSDEGRSWRGQNDHAWEPQQVGARGYDYDAGQQGRYGEGRGSTYTGERYGSQNSGRGDYGRDNQGAWDFERHGYAPGAEIWGGADRNASRDQTHDFEPDYLHWRDQQMASFDNEYRSWRDERRTRFTNDFDTWRKSRSENVKAEAANPYVGDVAEGGVGRVSTKSDDRNKQ